MSDVSDGPQHLTPEQLEAVKAAGKALMAYWMQLGGAAWKLVQPHDLTTFEHLQEKREKAAAACRRASLALAETDLECSVRFGWIASNVFSDANAAHMTDLIAWRKEHEQ